jgi:hypothetical protein
LHGCPFKSFASKQITAIFRFDNSSMSHHMENETGINFLLISSYFKGVDFIRSCKESGNTVFFLTSLKLKEEPWPYDCIDEAFYLQENAEGVWEMNDLISGLAWLMRKHRVDRVVALDDFDVEKAALVREEFRIPGMGQTTARYFRDKLAMRMRAKEFDIPVPAFTPLFNDQQIESFLNETSPPWLIKPRGEASATGIRKCADKASFYDALEQLGEKRHMYLAEQFKPGDVFHADAISEEGKVVFCKVSRYLATPMEVAHGGGVFRSVTLPDKDKESKKLQTLTARVMQAFGMQYSASHTEFIRTSGTGDFVFLETSSRVGGAHLCEMVEAATGINLWREWARLETAKALGLRYILPEIREDYAGIIVSLARTKDPDMSPFNADEIWWRIKKDFHVGMIVKSDNPKRVMQLLEEYGQIVARDYNAYAPVPDKPTN